MRESENILQNNQPQTTSFKLKNHKQFAINCYIVIYRIDLPKVHKRKISHDDTSHPRTPRWLLRTSLITKHRYIDYSLKSILIVSIPAVCGK